MASLSSYVAACDPVAMGHASPSDFPEKRSSPRRWPPPPVGLNETEKRFWMTARVARMKLERWGWPDFVGERKDGTFCGIEIKTGADVVSQTQAKMFALLEKVGMPVFVWRPERPVLTPWRKDAPAAKRVRMPPDPELAPVRRPKRRIVDRVAAGSERVEAVSPETIGRIYSETDLDPVAIRNWAEGKEVRAIIDRLCREACGRLQIPVQP